MNEFDQARFRQYSAVAIIHCLVLRLWGQGGQDGDSLILKLPTSFALKLRNTAVPA